MKFKSDWLGRTLIMVAVVACANVKSFAQAPTRIRLTDVTIESGIEFIHSDGGVGKRYIVESVVAGLATFDYDGDGYVDIFFVNGKQLGDNAGTSGSTLQAEFWPCTLYRNNGDFTFSDVTRAAGINHSGYGMGVVAADYDQDGDIDLYISNFGQNVFYQNNGDGTFAEATQSAGLILPDKVGAGCSFLDIENDGDLDLYVGSYVQFTLDKHKDRFIGKHQFHPGPTDYPPSSDVLFRNQGDGTFLDVSQLSGIGAISSYSMGVVAFDADDDGDTDIWVANDQRANSFWLNNGQGVFNEQAVISGVAFDRLGKANGNMGVEIGDVNGDGLMDLFTTTYQDEMPVLYANLGGGLFMDQTNILQIDNRLKPHVTWGCGLLDLDNDGDLDIYVACGHFMDNIGFIDDRTSVKVRDFVLENRNGKFVDVSSQVGSGLVVESSRGAAFEDLDNDGDLDVVVLNSNARPTLLKNELVPISDIQGGNYSVVGTQSNRSAVGAKVSLGSGEKHQIRQVVAGRGYQSHYGSRLHFSKVSPTDDTFVVVWPSGKRERFQMSNQVKEQILIEGQGEKAELR